MSISSSLTFIINSVIHPTSLYVQANFCSSVIFHWPKWEFLYQYDMVSMAVSSIMTLSRASAMLLQNCLNYFWPFTPPNKFRKRIFRFHEKLYWSFD